MQWFSVAQIVGYVSFLLGAVAFLQRSDQRMKLWLVGQSATYAIHFLLLGNPAAAAISVVSGTRSYVATRSKSLLVAAAFIVLSFGVGFAFAGRGPGWLPVAASIAATVAMFTMSGVPLRLVMLGATSLWLANDVLSRSIGGTALESMIAATNLWTIIRMVREPQAMPSGLAAEAD
jgi:uncharacterized membrane protein YbaN (DUF454 family)